MAGYITLHELAAALRLHKSNALRTVARYGKELGIAEPARRQAGGPSGWQRVTTFSPEDADKIVAARQADGFQVSDRVPVVETHGEDRPRRTAPPISARVMPMSLSISSLMAISARLSRRMWSSFAKARAHCAATAANQAETVRADATSSWRIAAVKLRGAGVSKSAW